MNSVLHALCGGSHHVAAQNLLGRGREMACDGLQCGTGNMAACSLQADLYSYTTVMSACTAVNCCWAEGLTHQKDRFEVGR